MIKHLKKIFIILLFGFIVSIGVFTSRQLQNKIKIEIQKSTHYTAAIEKLQKKNVTAIKPDTQDIKIEDEISYSITKIAEIILEKLKNNAIIPIRYQILGSADNQELEVQFNCPSHNFIAFLKQSATTKQPYSIGFLTVKTNETTVSGIFRVSETKQLLSSSFTKTQENSAISSAQMATLFKSKALSKHTNKNLPVQQKETVELTNADKEFKIIGTIQESNTFKYMYIKNFETNHIYKLALDGSEIDNNKIIENTATGYIIQLQDRHFLLQKKEVLK